MTRKQWRPRRNGARLFALVAVVIGLMLAPTSAQADPVRSESGDCEAQVTATEGENTATFTIFCESSPITGAQFETSQGVIEFVGFQGDQGGGLLCLPPAGTEFQCGGELAPNEVGTLEIATDDPCGNNFSIRNLALDTGEDQDPVTPQRDDEFATIQVQCGEDDAGSGGGGDGGADANDECPEEGGDTEHQNEDRERGEFEGEHSHSTTSGEECPDFPRGGVDSGFGGDAGRSSMGGGPGSLPLVIGGVGLVLLGLLGGGLTLVRR